jgi:hypothetical protein
LTSQIMLVAISTVSISDGFVTKFSVDLELHFHFCDSSLPSYIRHDVPYYALCIWDIYGLNWSWHI